MIKNFIYLDEQKLYSFSSQLFEGVTEYYLNQHSLENTDEETQKGSIASGRAIAEAVKEASTSTTKKFLHDYSFSLFEAELVNSGKLIDVATESYTHADICNSNKSFIRIRCKGKFVDMKEIQELFRHFNEIGDAIANAHLTPQYQELEKLKAENRNGPKTKLAQSELDKLVRHIKSNSELTLPKQILEGLDTIIEQFGDDIVRFQQVVGDVEYSSCLAPEYFRDSIKAVYRKYSRKTAKEFVVLGTISHSHGTQNVDIKDVPDSAPFLTHVIGLAENLYDLEQVFGSKGDNEIIIEPIAVYTEL